MNPDYEWQIADMVTILKELKRFKTGYEYKQMKSIKKIFDPHNIFNPGKVF